ncbi:tetratricopeptide repeat protein [Rubripirellula amarantea]|uniref:hypothetical protein n=1 Tax=Rubripirellula amarantea TaxID=2527999 RepID=UPI0011B6B1E1|nr:hypothetical protein [Rubripirellula amarantea]
MKLTKHKTAKRRALLNQIAAIAAFGMISGASAMAQDANMRPTRLPPTKSTINTASPASATPAANITAKANATALSHDAARSSLTTSVSSVSAPSKRWLKTSTSNATLVKARAMIEQARVEYASKAWVSAENSAWHAVQLCAQAIDQDNTEPGSVLAIDQFRKAKLAITEARDFGGLYGPVDSASVKRIAKAHQTKLLSQHGASELTATQASEYYLDYARVELAQIAADSVESAEAMDMLAATYLARGDEKLLPNETSLCLRRAALQGQPQNADLAARLGAQLTDVGLLDEAHWALQHSLGISYQTDTAQRLATVLRRKGDTRQADIVLTELHHNTAAGPTSIAAADPRVPAITRLSPEEFAALSGPVQQHHNASIQSPNNMVAAAPASAPTPQTGSLQTGSPQSTAPTLGATKSDASSGIRNPFRFAGARLNVSETQVATTPADADASSAQSTEETKKPNMFQRWFSTFRRTP